MQPHGFEITKVSNKNKTEYYMELYCSHDFGKYTEHNFRKEVLTPHN